MLIGALLALVASAITFILAQTVLDSLAQYGEKLEAIVGLVAIAVLLRGRSTGSSTASTGPSTSPSSTSAGGAWLGVAPAA